MSEDALLFMSFRP